MDAEIDDGFEPPAPKRKRISNGKTIRMMMMVEAEWSPENKRTEKTNGEN